MRRWVSSIRRRAPIVTIMGHVDHGKTTLLDRLRNTNAAQGEAGGITQHMGAFSVLVAGQSEAITFVDTPGHAAFAGIRQRGSGVSDIIVLVVALCDGVRPQTVESIQLAQRANTPLIVALNKSDLPGAPGMAMKIMHQLLAHNVHCEPLGGATQSVLTSALRPEGVSGLLQAILVQAEVMELAADYAGPVEATVVESGPLPGLGPCATLIVRRGTLRPGTLLVAGTALCRVRVLRQGPAAAAAAGPSAPVTVAGWRGGLPRAGVAAVEPRSREAAEAMIEAAERAEQKQREPALASIRQEMGRCHARMREVQAAGSRSRPLPRTMEYSDYAGGDSTGPGGVSGVGSNGPGSMARVQTFPVIVRCDVEGSADAIRVVLESIRSPKIRADVLRCAPGNVTLEDASLALSCGALVVTFGPKKPALPPTLRGAVVHFNIIYRLQEFVEEAMRRALPAESRDEILGVARVLRVFEIDNGRGRVAGCRVESGRVGLGGASKGQLVAIKRKGSGEGGREELVIKDNVKIVSLRNGSEEVRTVEEGAECGIIADCSLFRVGDCFQCYQRVSVPASL